MVDPREQVLADHIVQRLKGKIWIDGRGAIANQQAVVMHLTCIASLNDQGRPGPSSFADKVVMQPRGGQQARNRGVVFVDLAIRQDQDRCARVDPKTRGLE